MWKPDYKLLFSIAVLVFGFTVSGFQPFIRRVLSLQAPAGWPKPVYDLQKYPVTREGFELGRQLFYDPVLSRDSSISCSSCHLQYTAFTHVDHDLSHGIKDRIGTRNSPVIMNLAWSKHFMWDGAVNHLDMQALAPISNPAEMDEEISHVVMKLQRSPKYRTLFYQAYGDSAVTGQRVLKAFSQYMVLLTSSNAKYDQVKRKEPGVVFTSQENRGYAIFRKNCASCHAEPLFTNNGFANNGLPVDAELQDFGRMKITQKKTDSLHFKVPTLRNIEFSYPYMHDGRFKKLSQVINHYTSGVQHSNTLSPQLKKPVRLTHEEKTDLVAFLLTLTDKEFLFNPVFSFPKSENKISAAQE